MRQKFSREEVKINIDGEILCYTIFSKSLPAFVYLISLMDRINPDKVKNSLPIQHS